MCGNKCVTNDCMLYFVQLFLLIYFHNNYGFKMLNLRSYMDIHPSVVCISENKLKIYINLISKIIVKIESVKYCQEYMFL